MNARVGRWEGVREQRRPLPYNVRFSGRNCGSLAMAEPKEQLEDFDCSFKDLSIEG